MLLTRRYPCFNGYCSTLIGPTKFVAPATEWTCSDCGQTNPANIPKCETCLSDHCIKDAVAFKSKRLRVPAKAVGLVFEYDGSDYHYFFEYDQCQPVQLDANFDVVNPGGVRRRGLLRKVHYFINLGEEKLVMQLMNNGTEVYLEIVGSLKKIPARNVRYSKTKLFFDFEPHRAFELDNQDFICSKFTITQFGQHIPNDFGAELSEENLMAAEASCHEIRRTKLTTAQKMKVTDGIEAYNVPFICYDIETVIELPEDGFRLVPYMVAFQIKFKDLNLKKVFTNTRPYQCGGGAHITLLPWRRHFNEYIYEAKDNDFFEKGNRRDCEDEAGEFCPNETRNFEEGFIWLYEQIIKLVMTDRTVNRFLIFGFNNYNFDDIISAKWLQNSFHLALRRINGYTYSSENEGYYKLMWTENKRFNKTNAFTIRVTAQKNLSTWSKKQFDMLNLFDEITLVFKDCCAYVPNCSLKKACTDYNISLSKMDVDALAASAIIQHVKSVPDELPIDDKVLKLFPTLNCRMPALLFLKLKNFDGQNYQGTARNTIQFRKLLEDYCQRDVESTMLLFQSIVENLEAITRKYVTDLDDLRHPLSFLSLAQYSKYLFDHMVDHSIGNYDFDDYTRRLIDQTSFAGRTDYTILGAYTSANETLNDWDVTSEYPCAMTAIYPCGPYETVTDWGEIQQIIDSIYERRQSQFDVGLMKCNDIGYFGDLNVTFFAYADITPPDETRLIAMAPLATRVSLDGFELQIDQHVNATRLQYYNCAQQARPINSVQVKTLLYGGWSVRLLSRKGILWRQHTTAFRDYIDKIGFEKSEAREENKSYARMLKLIMNAIPGKFGQKTTHKCETVKREYAYVPFCDNEGFRDGNKWHNISKVYDCRIRDCFNYQQTETVISNNMHHMSSLIWSWANFLLWTASYDLQLHLIDEKKLLKDKVGTVLYCDTDSLIIDTARVNPNYQFDSSEFIGHFDYESHRFRATWKNKLSNFSTLMVFGKKSYFCLSKNGDVSLRRWKGVGDRTIGAINVSEFITACQQFRTKGTQQWHRTIEFETLARRKPCLFGIYTTSVESSREKITLSFPDEHLYNVLDSSDPNFLAVGSFLTNAPKKLIKVPTLLPQLVETLRLQNISREQIEQLARIPKPVPASHGVTQDNRSVEFNINNTTVLVNYDHPFAAAARVINIVLRARDALRDDEHGQDTHDEISDDESEVSFQI